MELVSTMEISGEEREIADAYARGQIDASNVSTVSGMSYSAEGDEINLYAKMEPNATVADRVNWHDDALNGVFDTMTAVKQNINSNIDGINSNLDTLSYGENSGSANLFDKSKIVRGACIGSDGYPYGDDNYGYSDYIHVEPNTEYTFMNVGWFNYYDANKSYVSQSTGGTSTTPSNAKYVIVSFELSVVNSVMVAKFHQTEYVPYVMSNYQLTQTNESLEDYGLNNLYDGLTRNGYYSGAGAFTSNNGAIANVNPYKCNAGDIITIKTDITRTDSRIVFLNSSGGAVSYVDNDFDKVSVPANATSFVFNFSPTNFNHIGVYINNSIDEIKNDLNAFIVTDLNSAERTGFYSFNSGASNIPESNTAGNLQVINGENFIHQIAYSGNIKIYMRRKDKSNDTWNDWKSTTLS